MKQRKLQRYIFEIFDFDMEKERALYDLLCHEKISRRRKRIILYEPEIKTYNSWKKRIVNRYVMYEKDSLVEFSRCLNLILRDSQKIDGYFQNICIVYISAIFAVIFDRVVNENVNNLTFWIIFLCLMTSFFTLWIYTEYSAGGKKVNFIQDVKEIIDEMIAK